MSHNVKEGKGFFRDQCDWCVLIRFLLGGSERRLRVGTADCGSERRLRGIESHQGVETGLGEIKTGFIWLDMLIHDTYNLHSRSGV